MKYPVVPSAAVSGKERKKAISRFLSDTMKFLKAFIFSSKPLNMEARKFPIFPNRFTRKNLIKLKKEKIFCFKCWRNVFMFKSFCYMESYEAQVCKQEEFYSHFEHRLVVGFATKQMRRCEKSIWQ